MLFLAEQDHRVDGESVAGWYPCGDEAYYQHCENDASEHDRIFGRGLIDDVGKHAGGEDA